MTTATKPKVTNAKVTTATVSFVFNATRSVRSTQASQPALIQNGRRYEIVAYTSGKNLLIASILRDKNASSNYPGSLGIERFGHIKEVTATIFFKPKIVDGKITVQKPLKEVIKFTNTPEEVRQLNNYGDVAGVLIDPKSIKV